MCVYRPAACIYVRGCVHICKVSLLLHAAQHNKENKDQKVKRSRRSHGGLWWVKETRSPQWWVKELVTYQMSSTGLDVLVGHPVREN